MTNQFLCHIIYLEITEPNYHNLLQSVYHWFELWKLSSILNNSWWRGTCLLHCCHYRILFHHCILVLFILHAVKCLSMSNLAYYEYNELLFWWHHNHNQITTFRAGMKCKKINWSLVNKPSLQVWKRYYSF